MQCSFNFHQRLNQCVNLCKQIFRESVLSLVRLRVSKSRSEIFILPRRRCLVGWPLVAVPALLSQWPPGPPAHNTVQHPVVRLDRHHGQGEEGRGQEGQGREEGGQQVYLRDLHVRVSVSLSPTTTCHKVRRSIPLAAAPHTWQPTLQRAACPTYWGQIGKQP